MTVSALATLLLVAQPPVTATDWYPDTFALEQTGSYPFSRGDPLVVDEARGFAFVGSGAGVLAIDISDPASPRVVSDAIRCYAPAHNLWLDGDRLYVGMFYFYMRQYCPRDVEIWSVADPADPLLLGSIDFSLGRPGLWARDSLLFVAGLYSFGSYDVSDPGQPAPLDSLWLDQTADMVRVLDDTLALVPVWAAGVEVYDIADPRDLRFLARWGETNVYSGIDVAGDRLFLTAFNGPLRPWSGLRIYDISDPLNGQLLGVFDTSQSTTFRVAVRDSVALLSYLGGPLKVLSVADPSAPESLATCDVEARGVVWGESLAYVAALDRFEVLDLSDPRSPRPVGSVPVSFAYSDLAVDGNRAYTLGYNLGVLDVGGPGDVELLGVLELGEYAFAVAQHDTLVLLVCHRPPDTLLLDVVGVSDPANPVLRAVDTVFSDWGEVALALEDTLGYVATTQGLSVYSLADPTIPRLVGRCGVAMSPRRMVVTGNACLVAGDRLRAFDVSDPAFPVLNWDTTMALNDIALADTFLCGLGNHLSVFSVGDPTRPRWCGECRNVQGHCIAADDTVAVTTGMNGMTVVSIANPRAPALVNRNEGIIEANRLVLRGDTLHTAEYRRYRLLTVPTGVGERRPVPVAGRLDGPTVVRGTLRLEPGAGGVLMDACGRVVAVLQSGENDVRHLCPGVYFVCPAGPGSRAGGRKVVLTR